MNFNRTEDCEWLLGGLSAPREPDHDPREDPQKCVSHERPEEKVGSLRATGDGDRESRRILREARGGGDAFLAFLESHQNTKVSRSPW